MKILFKKTEDSKRRRFNLGGLLFVSLLLTVQISAHDLGISSLNISAEAGKITVASSYAKNDIEKIVSLDDSSGLRSLAGESLELTAGSERLEPESVEAIEDDADGIIFRRMFSAKASGSVKIRSLLPIRLGRGHKQYLTVTDADGQTIARQILSGPNNSFVFDFGRDRADSSFGAFFPLGIGHILFGFDHLLFLLVLLMTVKSGRETIKIITAFTVAHSITLSLAALEVIRIPGSTVEPLIALSIVFAGLENIFKPEGNNRPLLAYGFGLIHGLGFASALQEVGIGRGFGAIIPLLSFNLGVEIGQLAVALAILPLLRKLQKCSFFPDRLNPMVSSLIILVGAFWFIERMNY
ncbi:MAG: HupE/UreJ family protein [Pyrinomonadaceae bacterium]